MKETTSGYPSGDYFRFQYSFFCFMPNRERRDKTKNDSCIYITNTLSVCSFILKKWAFLLMDQNWLLTLYSVPSTGDTERKIIQIKHRLYGKYLWLIDLLKHCMQLLELVEVVEWNSDHIEYIYAHTHVRAQSFASSYVWYPRTRRSKSL